MGFALTALLVGSTTTGAMALEEQIEAAMRRGYVAAFRILGDPEDARDACQEAAARVLAARDRYDPKQPLYPWFYRVLKNHCLDRLRHRGRVEARFSDQVVVDGTRSAEAQLLHDELADLVLKLVEIGLITPPIGINIFVVSGIVKEPAERIFRAITPFILLDIAVTAVLFFFPDIVLFLPRAAGLVP